MAEPLLSMYKTVDSIPSTTGRKEGGNEERRDREKKKKVRVRILQQGL